MREPNAQELKDIEHEVKHYQSLTEDQKQAVSALVALKFHYRYPKYYHRVGWGEINIDRVADITGIIAAVYELGRESKAKEIRSVLGVVD